MSMGKLKDLIKQGEGNRIEFKRGLSGKKLVESMVAFNNTKGGTILVGVGKGGTIQGVEDPETLRNTISNIARDNIDPGLSPEFENVRIDGKIVLVVGVAQGDPRSTFGIFYVRSGATNRRATTDEVEELVLRKNGFIRKDGEMYYRDQRGNATLL